MFLLTRTFKAFPNVNIKIDKFRLFLRPSLIRITFAGRPVIKLAKEKRLVVRFIEAMLMPYTELAVLA
jgi:hypothetical protein